MKFTVIEKSHACSSASCAIVAVDVIIKYCKSIPNGQLQDTTMMASKANISDTSRKRHLSHSSLEPYRITRFGKSHLWGNENTVREYKKQSQLNETTND